MAQNRALARTETAATVASMLAANMKAMRSVIPSSVTPERMARVAVSAIRKSPQLQKCKPESLVKAIMQAATLGLEIDDGLGRAYLVPYKDEATMIVGYKGLVDLAWRSGLLASINFFEVYEGEFFERVGGLDPKINHQIGDETDPAKITHVYVVVSLKNGGKIWECMSRDQIEAIRKRSRAGSSGPWVTDWPAMARKTVLRRVLKIVPSSTTDQNQTLQRAVTIDEGNEIGEIVDVEIEDSATATDTDLSIDDIS